MNEPLLPQIHQIWQSNMQVYGADKIWKQMRREGITVARCTAVRLMRRSGLRGVRPGKVVRTTTADATAARPLDRWTGLIGSSTRTVLISFGYRTSCRYRPGRAGRTWLQKLTILVDPLQRATVRSRH